MRDLRPPVVQMVCPLSHVVAVVTYATRSTVGPGNSSWQGSSYTPDVIRSFEHHTGESTIWLSSTPILRENNLWRSSEASHLFSPSTNLKTGLMARRPNGTGARVTIRYTRWVADYLLSSAQRATTIVIFNFIQ
ncbi:hypothetical protein TNCV_3312491 [Trichonephila clavipes]|nr:hypothetical protein TNCV_3312491 [Trichonephila clavipes]